MHELFIWLQMMIEVNSRLPFSIPLPSSILTKFQFIYCAERRLHTCDWMRKIVSKRASVCLEMREYGMCDNFKKFYLSLNCHKGDDVSHWLYRRTRVIRHNPISEIIWIRDINNNQNKYEFGRKCLPSVDSLISGRTNYKWRSL